MSKTVKFDATLASIKSVPAIPASLSDSAKALSTVNTLKNPSYSNSTQTTLSNFMDALNSVSRDAAIRARSGLLEAREAELIARLAPAAVRISAEQRSIADQGNQLALESDADIVGMLIAAVRALPNGKALLFEALRSLGEGVPDTALNSGFDITHDDK